MKLNKLPKTTTRNKKRIGRGYGSKKGGHTVGRGQKGQKSRSSIPIWFEGGQLPQIRRFPFIKGKGRFKSLNPETVVITLDQLNKIPKDTTVTSKTLLDLGYVTQKELETKTIKVLANGTLEKPLTIKLPTSKGAAKRIVAAGGKVERG